MQQIHEQEATARVANRLEEEQVTRPDGWREDREQEAGADPRPEDWPPRRVLTYRDLIGMQRRLKGNRSLLSLRSSNGRTNSLRLALAGLSVALWAFALHAHGIGWTVMMVAGDEQRRAVAPHRVTGSRGPGVDPAPRGRRSRLSNNP